jgi:hypothetical protein
VDEAEARMSVVPFPTDADDVEVDDAPVRDRIVDRRRFLGRMAAAVAGAGVAGAAPSLFAGAGAAPRQLPGPPNLDAYATPRPEAVADPTELTIAEAATLIRDGLLTPLELVEAYLVRIAAFDETYKAWNLVLADEARAAAIAVAAAPNLGPLHGIPLAIKDNYYTAGILTTANSFIFEEFRPPFDATAVARLEASGDLIRAATPTFQGGGRVRVRFPTRIGILPGYAADSSETATARQRFIDTVAGFGRATVVEVTPPPEFAVLTSSAFNNVRLPERSEPFMPFLREDLGLFGVSLTSWLQGALLGAKPST